MVYLPHRALDESITECMANFSLKQLANYTTQPPERLSYVPEIKTLQLILYAIEREGGPSGQQLMRDMFDSGDSGIIEKEIVKVLGFSAVSRFALMSTSLPVTPEIKRLLFPSDPDVILGHAKRSLFSDISAHKAQYGQYWPTKELDLDTKYSYRTTVQRWGIKFFININHLLQETQKTKIYKIDRSGYPIYRLSHEEIDMLITELEEFKDERLTEDIRSSLTVFLRGIKDGTVQQFDSSAPHITITPDGYTKETEP